MDTTKNKENQEEVSLNDNEHDEQSEEDLEKFKKEVRKIIENPYDSFFISKICLTTNKHLSKYGDLAKISDTISEIIKDNPDLARNIINGFAQGYIPEENDLAKISNIISQIIQTDGIKDKPELAHNIINGFAEACISTGKDLTKIGNAISKINKENSGPDLVNNNKLIEGILVLHEALSPKSDYFSNDKGLTEICNAFSKIAKTVTMNMPNIINNFVRTCTSEGKDLKKIGNVIFKIAETDIESYNLACILDAINPLIETLIETYTSEGTGLTENDNLNVISKIGEINRIRTNITSINRDLDFIQNCLAKKSDDIKNIAKDFFNLLNTINKDNFGEKEEEIKDKLKLTFSLIVSQHLINTLTNSSNKQLSEEDKKQTETQLFECYKKLFHVEDKQEFQNISLKELLDLQEEYLKKRFKKKGVNGGLECETFLKTACNLIPKSEGNKELTVKDLEKQKDIFKDLKFIDLHDNKFICNSNNIKSKKELFNAIGLGPKDFGTDKKGSDFGIVYCNYLEHAFVMIIDKTKEWKDAIDENIESIYLIDSSRCIENKKIREDTQLNKREQIFKTTPTLNQFYQENGTCWLNAMSAVGFLLEKQQERIAEQKQEQQEQVEQTEQHEQQPRKPYGLSINELKEGFIKKDEKEHDKSISENNLSLFEQGICDYSTEHFYPLTGISDEERDIIRELLIKKIKQNKADQRKLSTTSSRLEKSKEEQDKTSEEEISKISSESGGLNDENFIIGYNYLKESLERFTQDTEKLKELCAKFDIKDIQLLELEQKEDLSSRKRSIDSCLGDIASVEETSEYQKATEITKQSVVDETQQMLQNKIKQSPTI